MADTKESEVVTQQTHRDTDELVSMPPPKYGSVETEFVAPVEDQTKPVATVYTTFPPEQFGTVPTERECKNCHQHIVTRVEKKNGWMPWLICGGLTLIGCWLGCCLIPFCIDDLKDVTHYCPKCGAVLGEKKLL